MWSCIANTHTRWYTHVHTHTSVHTHIHTHVCTHTYTSVHTHTHTHTRLYTHTETEKHLLRITCRYESENGCFPAWTYEGGKLIFDVDPRVHTWVWCKVYMTGTGGVELYPHLGLVQGLHEGDGWGRTIFTPGFGARFARGEWVG